MKMSFDLITVSIAAFFVKDSNDVHFFFLLLEYKYIKIMYHLLKNKANVAVLGEQRACMAIMKSIMASPSPPSSSDLW